MGMVILLTASHDKQHTKVEGIEEFKMKTIGSLQEAFWQSIGKDVNISGNEKIKSKYSYIYIFINLLPESIPGRFEKHGKRI